MRRVRPDVSHRIRRQPSIFSASWFRMLLGTGLVLALALLIGPRVSAWLGGDLPRSLFLLAPWSSATSRSERGPIEPAGQKPAGSGSVASPPTSTSPAAPRGAAAATSRSSSVTLDGKPGTTGRAAPGSAAAPPPSAVTRPPAAATEPKAPAPPAAPTDSPGGRAASLASPPVMYWVQVGAFLEHKNADRLAERLRSEGLPAATTAFEQSRVLYRVLLTDGEGGSVSEDTLERSRKLGHTIETTPDGPAVAGSVPLRRAVEISHALRQQGVRVRLKQEVSSSTYRIVRVGSFATVAEAEATLTKLVAKGVEGMVVREQ